MVTTKIKRINVCKKKKLAVYLAYSKYQIDDSYLKELLLLQKDPSSLDAYTDRSEDGTS